MKWHVDKMGWRHRFNQPWVWSRNDDSQISKSQQLKQMSRNKKKSCESSLPELSISKVLNLFLKNKKNS